MLDVRPVRRGGARLVRLMLGIAVTLSCVSYCIDVQDRARAGEPPYRWRTDVATVEGVSYTAKTAFTRGQTVLLKLYRTGDPTLLAQRTFTEHGVALRWSQDGWLIYDTSDDSYLGGEIQLPPTRLDNLLAKLP